MGRILDVWRFFEKTHTFLLFALQLLASTICPSSVACLASSPFFRHTFLTREPPYWRKKRP